MNPFTPDTPPDEEEECKVCELGECDCHEPDYDSIMASMQRIHKMTEELEIDKYSRYEP